MSNVDKQVVMKERAAAADYGDKSPKRKTEDKRNDHVLSGGQATHHDRPTPGSLLGK